MLLGIIGLSAFVYNTTEIDEATRELALVQQQNSTLENHIRNQVNQLELRKEIAALITVTNIMQKEVNTLRDEIVTLRDDEVQARKDFEQAILKSRQDAAGLMLNDATLPSGVRLRNARVQKVEGDVTTIIHSEGISKFTPEMLPTELQDRFRFGVPIGGSTPSSSASTPKPAVNTTVQMPPASPSKDKLKEGRIELDRLRKELPYLEQELQKAEADTSADASPSRRFYAKNRRDSISQQITAIKRKIDAIEIELRKLE